MTHKLEMGNFLKNCKDIYEKSKGTYVTKIRWIMYVNRRFCRDIYVEVAKGNTALYACRDDPVDVIYASLYRPQEQIKSRNSLTNRGDLGRVLHDERRWRVF